MAERRGSATPSRPARRAAVARKAWSVLVYLAGDNNLDDAGTVDLAEMKSVGSTGGVDVVAQVDRAGRTGSTHRYHLRRGTTLAQDRVATLPETNSGDPAVLLEFLRWGVATYPADRTLVVLWNHGAGWDDTDIYRSPRRKRARAAGRRRATAVDASAKRAARPADVRTAGRHLRPVLFASSERRGLRTRGILYDDDAGDFLDSLELKKVVAKVKRALGRKIDVLGLDACLMSMVEVAYQVRGAVDVQVGSEELEPADGWPYAAILRKLSAKPRMEARELGSTIVAEYLAAYRASDVVTQSALDLATMGDLRRAIDGLARALVAGCADPATLLAIVRARRSVQHYDTKAYVDLAHLCERLKALGAPDPVADECDIVLAAVAAAVLASGSKGSAVANSQGLSIYFPETPVSPLYARLDFAKESAWDRFLDAYRRALAG